jgi:hypothetical protein
MKLYYTDVFTEEEIQNMLDEYNSVDEYNTSGMNKASPGPATKSIDELMDGYERIGGNYYQHKKPYLPHTDHREEWRDTVNVVVPLQTTDPNASLVIFDQKYYRDSVTWCLHMKVKHFSVNTGVAGKPCDYDCDGLTDEPIDDDLYEYLKWAPKEQWYGLTGDAYSFTPGSAILFDNKHIHATGVLQGVKTGISLRYKV